MSETLEAAPLLKALDMARFVARGFLRFDAVVPEAGDSPGPGQKLRRT